MGRHDRTELLPAGTELQSGEAPPPVKSNKALRASFWAALPIFIAVVVTAFQQLGTFYPDAPDWLLRTAAYLLMVLGPAFAYFGVNRSKDQLRQPVETLPGTSLEGTPIPPGPDPVLPVTAPPPDNPLTQ